MISKYVFYLDLPVFDFENFEDVQFKSFYSHIKALIRVGEQLKANIYYPVESFSKLNDFVNEFKEEFNRSQGDHLELLLENTLPNNGNIHPFNINYLYEQSSISLAALHSLHEEYHSHTIIIINKDRNAKVNVLYIDSKKSDFHKIQLNFFSTPQEIWKLINSNQHRDYHFSPKHGNDIRKANPPNGEKASQLRCSDDRAQVLLEDAIFDLRKKSNFLFNFDEIFGTYIVFPSEGVQNKYHAYHVEKYEWKKEIPSSVRKYFGKE